MTTGKPAPDTRVHAKVKRLRELIEHKRTGAHERDTAARMLARILAKYDWRSGATADPGAGPYANWHFEDPRVFGSKYNQVKNASLPQIAKLIRADIRLAQKIGRSTAAPGQIKLLSPIGDAIGDAPAEIRYSVRSQYYSGGGSIDIYLLDIPEEWGWAMRRHPRFGKTMLQPTPALDALVEELKGIHRAYNYDGGDPYTDLVWKRYAGEIAVGNGAHNGLVL